MHTHRLHKGTNSPRISTRHKSHASGTCDPTTKTHYSNHNHCYVSNAHHFISPCGFYISYPTGQTNEHHNPKDRTPSFRLPAFHGLSNHTEKQTTNHTYCTELALPQANHKINHLNSSHTISSPLPLSPSNYNNHHQPSQSTSSSTAPSPPPRITCPPPRASPAANSARG